MTDIHSPRRILEIGPAQMPLHHRGSAFELKEGESYTAIDQSSRVFNTAVWDTLREKHPGRILTVEANSNDIPIPEEPYDEIVCLGSVVTDEAIHRLVEQMPKILKPGGRLRLGLAVYNQAELWNVADFCDKWNATFRHYGLQYRKQEGQSYDYAKRRRAYVGDDYPDNAGSPQYAVLTYERVPEA